MANIRVTPEVLSDQGQALRNYAKELVGILDVIDAKIKEIDSSWDGLSQNAYLDMYTHLKKSLDQFPILVDELGETTMKSATAFSNLDTDLQNTFNSAR